MSCAKFETARECGVFVPAMNGWQNAGQKSDEPQTGASSPPPVEAGRVARKVAERYDALSHEIEALKLESPELSSRALRYRKLAESAASALRDVASAVDRGDGKTARRRRREFDALAAGEGKLVAEINEICR